MATECRKKTYRHKLVRFKTWVFLAALVFLGGLAGYFIGKSQAKVTVETVTVTETVEVPTYEGNGLPEIIDVFYFDVPLSHSLQRYMYEVCADENVPITLVMAMVEYESQFDPEVVSSTNDYGLMQINAQNHAFLAEKYRAADMLDPYQNVFCGIKIIGEYIEKYDSNYNKALMGYNMGDYGANKAWENGIYSTSYTDTVLGLWKKYEEVYTKEFSKPREQVHGLRSQPVDGETS